MGFLSRLRRRSDDRLETAIRDLEDSTASRVRLFRLLLSSELVIASDQQDLNLSAEGGSIITENDSGRSVLIAAADPSVLQARYPIMRNEQRGPAAEIFRLARDVGVDAVDVVSGLEIISIPRVSIQWLAAGLIPSVRVGPIHVPADRVAAFRSALGPLARDHPEINRLCLVLGVDDNERPTTTLEAHVDRAIGGEATRSLVDALLAASKNLNVVSALVHEEGEPLPPDEAVTLFGPDVELTHE